MSRFFPWLFEILWLLFLKVILGCLTKKIYVQSWVQRIFYRPYAVFSHYWNDGTIEWTRSALEELGIENGVELAKERHLWGQVVFAAMGLNGLKTVVEEENYIHRHHNKPDVRKINLREYTRTVTFVYWRDSNETSISRFSVFSVSRNV